MFRATCAHRQGVKIVLYSLWYHHTYRWPSRAQVERGLVGIDVPVSQVCFWNKALHVSDSSSVRHQEFFTVYTAMVYVIELASRIRTERPDPVRKLSANLYDIYHCCVYSEKLLMMDRRTVRNM